MYEGLKKYDHTAEHFKRSFLHRKSSQGKYVLFVKENPSVISINQLL